MAARPPRIDGLTGLTNRRTFDGFLRREYEARDEIAVLLFDIDNFKGYNDTYGHQAGDRLPAGGCESHRRRQKPLDARRSRLGGRSRHRAL